MQAARNAALHDLTMKASREQRLQFFGQMAASADVG
jgi:hypothetical protein